MAPRIRSIWHSASGASRFGSRFFLTLGTNGVLAVLWIVTGSIAARLLGPDGRGELAAVQTWPTFLASIALLGVPEALVYYSARFRERGGSYLTSAIAVTLLASGVFALFGYIAMPYLLRAQTPQVIDEARSYLLLIPLTALVGMPGHALRGRNDLVYWNALRLSPSIAWLGVLIGAYILQQFEPGFVATAYLLMLILIMAPVAVVTLRRVPGPYAPEPRYWPDLLRFGFPTLLGGIPKQLNFRLDQMLLAALFPARMLGLYIVALAWSKSVHPLLAALGAVFFPHVAAGDEPERRARDLGLGVRLGLLLSIAVTVPMFLLTPLAIPLIFGRDYAPAILASLVLVVAEAVAGFNHIVEEGLRGLGQPKKVMWAELTGLVVTGAGLLLLLRPFGIVGASVASLLSYTTVAVILVVHTRRLTGQSVRALLFPVRSELELVLSRSLDVLRAVFSK